MPLTKNKFFLFLLFTLLLSGMFLAGINQGQAVGAAYFPQDTTVSMTVDSFTIVGPSDADAVTTTATTATVTVSGGQSFTFKSPTGKQLNTTGIVTSTTCTPSASSVTITPGSGASARTVVITPTSSGCDSSGSGGIAGSRSTSSSGGGGGGTTVALATPTPVSTSLPQATPIPTPTLTPTPTSGVNYPPVPTYTPSPTSLPGASSAKLYRKSGDSKVYVAQANGSLKLIKSLDDFYSAGYRWQNVKVIANKDFSKLKIDTSSNAPVLATPKPTPTPLSVLTHLRIKSRVKFVNIRSAGSVQGKIVGRALSGQEFEFSDYKNGWYKIKKDGKDLGWISGNYTSKF